VAAKKQKTNVKPTTMRIPAELLAACSRAAKKQDRSRSWLINGYIRAGLARDGEKLTQPRGALD